MDNTQNAELGENSLALAEEIVRILDANKAGQLKLLRVNDQTVMTDYFVICTGNSNTHIKSLSGEVEYKLGDSNGLRHGNGSHLQPRAERFLQA